MHSHYKVTKQYGSGPVSTLATFHDGADAKLFVEAKLQEDAALKIKVTYRVIDAVGDLVSEHLPGEAQTASASSSSQGASSTASFRPTPFNTAPRPAGTPHKWVKDEEEEKK